MANTFSSLLDLIYPVGSIHLRTLCGTVKTLPEPATYLGGQWAHIQNRFLFSGDANESQYPLGKLDGEFYHTLTESETPSHNHYTGQGYRINVSKYGGLTSTNTVAWDYIPEDGSSPNRTTFYGGGEAHNNMPPYEVIRAWKRMS